MKKMTLILSLILFLGLSLSLTGCSGSKQAVIPESDETLTNWILARRFQAEGRYELAEQYYGLALSAARTQSGLLQLQHELDAVQLQIRTLR